MSFEAEATAITDMSLLVLPGMPQTQDYTRTMLACFEVPERESERRVIIRSGRQVILTKPRPPASPPSSTKPPYAGPSAAPG